MAIFKRKHLNLILFGRKTQTRRTHKHGWHVGRVYGLRDRWFEKAENHILITRKFRQKLGDISLEDIRKEGYDSLEGFQKAWIEINGAWDPDQVITAYEFKLLDAAKKGKASSAGENCKS
jgi:hypothetical protein